VASSSARASWGASIRASDDFGVVCGHADGVVDPLALGVEDFGGPSRSAGCRVEARPVAAADGKEDPEPVVG
jgi:hypothetical protein